MFYTAENLSKNCNPTYCPFGTRHGSFCYPLLYTMLLILHVSFRNWYLTFVLLVDRMYIELINY